MAHLTIEYSANLRAGGDLGGLCARLAACLAAQRDGAAVVFPVGGIRVRAIPCEDYCIADGAPDAAFVHAILKLGAGRSAAVARLTKRAVRAGEELPFDAALAEAERIYLDELASTEDMAEGLAAFLAKRPPVWRHR